MRRSAYTLVEVLLALGIAVLLLGALYVAVDTQLRTAQAGRDKVEQSSLARTLFSRMDDDAACVIGQGDPARFRGKQSGSSSSSTTPASGSSTTTPASGSSTTPASGSSTTTPASGSSTTSTATITSMSLTGTVSTYTNANGVQVVLLPYGVIGTSTTLNLFVSRVPRETINAQLQQQEGTATYPSDLRRISYWLVGDNGSGQGQGIAKQEVKFATSDDSGAVDQSVLPPNVDNPPIFMEEVRSLRFQYFDGTNWLDEWDSTQLPSQSGSTQITGDGVTPIGSPVAIKVTVGIASPNNPNLPVKTYSHVIALLTASGTTPMPQTASSTTTGGGTTSP